MTGFQFILSVVFVVFLYISIIQWRNQHKFRKLIIKITELSSELTHLVERENAVIAEKEKEILRLKGVVKELDAEIAFNKCKKEGI